MSIVTYDDLDTPVFEIDFPRYLFANGEQGSLWGPLPYYSDAAGTVEADWGDPVGNIPDSSGNGQDWTQVTSTARPIFGRAPVGGRRNLLTDTDGGLWNLPTVSGGDNTGALEILPDGVTRLYQNGEGGVATGPLPNTGAGAFTRAVDIKADGYNFARISRSINSNAAGSVLLNLLTGELVANGSSAGDRLGYGVSSLGDGWWRLWASYDTAVVNARLAVFATSYIGNADAGWASAGNTPALGEGILLRRPQLESGAEPTPYQRVGNEYDITEAGVRGIHYLRFDGTDDQVTTTLPAISGGTIVLAGTNGIWIDSLDFAGGAFSVGPDTYTGGPAGLMSILGDILVGGGFVIDRALTPKEIAQVKGYYVARGSAGLIELGPELGQQPLDFTDGWIASTAATVLSSTSFSVTANGGVTRDFGLNTGELYLLQSSFERDGGTLFGYYNYTTSTPVVVSSSVSGLFNHVFPAADHRIYARIGGAGEVSVDYLSIRRLIMPGETP